MYHPFSYRCLGRLQGANMNTTADQAIAINSGSYLLRRIIGTNASLSLSVSVGGIYTAASKGGTAIVAAAQVYSALTGATKALDLTIAVADRLTSASLYLSLTVAQGSAATLDLYFYGEAFDR